MELVVKSREELAATAKAFLARIRPQEAAATLVTLAGELGAGKTALVQEIARALGVGEHVTSPTFVLEKIYQLPSDSAQGEKGKAFSRLVHIDAYRLSSGKELAPLGFDEIMKDPRNLVMLEWPERVREALPEPAIAVLLAVLSDGSRRITYT